MSQFEQWFIAQDFYTNMRFIHGDTLFLRDGDVYRVLPVQMTYIGYCEIPVIKKSLRIERCALEAERLDNLG